MTILTQILDLAVAIQQIPAPTFEEATRAESIHQRFQAEGLADVSLDETGNVYARLSGSGDGRAAVVSAHLDTVFPGDTDLRIRREPDQIYGPGIGDNSLGLAGLFGLVWQLRRDGFQLPGDLWLVANVGEEGLGDLRGMKAVVDRFGSGPIGYIVLEGMALGQVYHRALGVKRYRVTARTAGGHSWIDYGQPSAIQELAGLVTQLGQLELPPAPRTTLNVGMIGGGTSVNTIAAEAAFELDLRSEGVETLATLAADVERLAGGVVRPGLEITVEVIGRRPAGEIPADHPLVLLAGDCLRSQGFSPVLAIGSTDANIPLSLGLPAVAVGLTRGGAAHTVHEYIQTGPLEKGMEQLVQLVVRIFDQG